MMKTYDLEYQVETVNCRGYVAEPQTQGQKVPGIVLYTDFWGLNARQKKVAERLSNLGAVVHVADMYGDQKFATTFEDSGKLMQALVENEETYRKRTLAAFDLLRKNPLVNPQKVFAIGYCFGGKTALQLARTTEGLCGAISVHGLLTSKIRVAKDKKMPKLLILNGDKDPFVTDADIRAFRDEMHACNADFTFVSFGLSTHAFSNEDAAGDERTAYNYLADKRSYALIREFIGE